MSKERQFILINFTLRFCMEIYMIFFFFMLFGFIQNIQDF